MSARIITGAALAVALGAAPARAHFLWLQVEPAEQRLRLHFGEDGVGIDGEGELPERLVPRLAALEVLGPDGAPIALEAGEARVSAALGGARAARTAMLYGLHGHAKPRYLLRYHAKGCAGLAEAGAPLGGGAELLAERVGDELVLTVLLDGAPVELAEVVAMLPGGGTEVYDTDARGEVRVPAAEAGAFHARAEIELPQSGEHEGEPYGKVKHYATLLVAELRSRAHLVPTAAVEPWGLMPHEVTSFGAATHGGHVYVLGGYSDVPHDYHAGGQSEAFARLSLVDRSWEQLPSPGGMQSVALVAHGAALYRVGGMQARNARGEPEDLRSIDAFARFDPLAREWTALAPLPAPRSSHDAAVLGEHLYVVGGWRMKGAGGGAPEWHDALLRIDLSDPQARWESIPAPFRRRALGVAAAGGQLVAIGGMDASGSVSKAVDVLDPASGAWRRGPDFPETGFGLAAYGLDGRVYASAGDGVVFTWAPGEPEWSQVSAWAFPRFFHRLAPGSEGELLALGGIARGGRVRHVERLHLAGEGARRRARVTRWELPAPSPNASGAALFLAGNLLCSFGGTREGLPVREARRLDLAALRFERCEPLPEPLAASARLTGGGRALAIGGFTSAGDGSAERAAVHAYDAGYDLWDPADFELPGPRAGGAALEQEERLWLFGGGDTAVLVREPGAAAFVEAGLVLPRARRDFSALAWDGRIALVGGVDGSGAPLATCDVLDLDSGTFSEIAGPGASCRAQQAAALGGRLYALAGRALERYDAARDRWQVVLPELDAAPEAELALLAFGERLLVHAAVPGAARVELLLVDLGTTERVERDVAGHFRR